MHLLKNQKVKLIGNRSSKSSLHNSLGIVAPFEMKGVEGQHLQKWSEAGPAYSRFQLHSANNHLDANDPPSDSQKVNSSLTLHHNAQDIHLASSHHKGILSSHSDTRSVSTILRDQFM